MSNNAITVDRLGKKYRIGLHEQRHDTLTGAVLSWAKSPLVNFRQLRKLRTFDENEAADDVIWALKDVSFEVGEGEVVGIIGRNGAGKSTLLKILARITEPTSGRAIIHGRVASLLEVGTGFHPELTGRENVYLNGTVLGMTKVEVDRKFDEIVAFSGVDKFIDTPVKRYSSGMRVRLAFSVAAHLDPEILLVDEVLAVGDAAFQKKCLGKMHDVTQQGRTVLFVSHVMASVKALCNRVLLLENGSIALEGDSDHVVDAYLSTGADVARDGVVPEDAPRLGTGAAAFRFVEITNTANEQVAQLYFGDPFRVTIHVDVHQPIQDAIFEVSIAVRDGTHVVQATSVDDGRPLMHLSKGQHTVSVDLDLVLLPRQYVLILGLHHSDGLTIDFIEDVISFEVLHVGAKGNDHYRWEHVRGLVRPVTRWHHSGAGATSAIAKSNMLK